MRRIKTYKINDLQNSDVAGSKVKVTMFPIYIAIGVIAFLLGSRLFTLQILDGNKYLAASNQNYKVSTTIRAPRGLIYSSDGKKIAQNANIYSVFINPKEFDFEKDAQNLASLLNLTTDDIKLKIDQAKDQPRVTIRRSSDHNEYLDYLSKIESIKGVYSVTEIGRNYNNPYVYAHIIGYVGDPSLDEIDEDIDQNSTVGKTGLEKIYDSELRGVDGVQISETDINSKEDKIYIPTNPIIGDNLIMTIDGTWQESAFQLLRDKVNSTGGLGGSFVIMDSDTGEVKTMVSFPTFDINKFSEGISAKDFNALLTDPSSPLLDRSVSVALPPGSIFKVLVGSAALQSGVIDTNTKYFSNACMSLSGGTEFCESFFRRLGDVDIYRAIKLSSNIFFCNAGLDMEKKASGINTLRLFTDQFGIGMKTGINLLNESNGTMSSVDLKRKVFAQPWFSGDLCNTNIGQGLVSVTPIQMAVAVSSIFNGGKILKPYIVDNIQDQDGNIIKRFQSEEVRKVEVEEKNFQIIRDAMEKAVRDSDGTLRKLSSIKYRVWGKTGTATAPVELQGKYYDAPHAWVTGVFEYNGKKYTFVINIAHGGWGEGALDVIKGFLEQI